MNSSCIGVKKIVLTILIGCQHYFRYPLWPGHIDRPKGASIGWKTGFEPATSGTTIQRSNQLSYNHHFKRSQRYFILGIETKKIVGILIGVHPNELASQALHNPRPGPGVVYFIDEIHELSV